MTVVCDVNVKGMNGKTCHARMFVEHPKGKPWYDINGQYRSLIGMVSEGFNFVPNYDDCYYNDGFQIWIPVSELHLTPDEKQYFVKVAIYSGSFENQLNLLGESDYIDFNGSGGSNIIYQEVIEDGNSSGGGYIPAPVQPSQQRQTCGVCYGSGKCWNCHGSGISLHNSGIYATCGACNGTGKCSNCYGEGYKTY